MTDEDYGDGNGNNGDCDKFTCTTREEMNIQVNNADDGDDKGNDDVDGDDLYLHKSREKYQGKRNSNKGIHHASNLSCNDDDENNNDDDDDVGDDDDGGGGGGGGGDADDADDEKD